MNPLPSLHGALQERGKMVKCPVNSEQRQRERNMNQADRPIGVFDSGVGGISALQAMIRVLPQEHFIYYGDTANAPYGTKETGEVIPGITVTEREDDFSVEVK